MKITDETIDHLARLSKLQFKDEQRVSIKQDLEKMIDFVKKIEELDTTGLEPLVHVNREVNILREDEACETIAQNEALKNAPSKDSDYFKIATVLSK